MSRLNVSTERRLAKVSRCCGLAVTLLCLVTVEQAVAQEVTVEFEDFFTDFAKFDEHSTGGFLITGGSNVGVGGTGGLTLPARHSLTYTPLSFSFAAHGDAVTASAFFKTGTLGTPAGSGETIGEIYITSESYGNPIQAIGSNDFYANLFRDSLGTYLRIGGQIATGGSYPFLETDISISSNRWYELSATFTRNQQAQLDASLRVTDYGSTGLTSQGVVGTISSGFTAQTSNFADATWYGGFGADADNGVKADRFKLDVPGSVGSVELSIEPTYDVTYWPGGPTRFRDGENELQIDGGEAQFPVLKALAEFELGDIPANAEVTAASLVIEPTFVSSSSMAVRVMGYPGDGTPTAADPASVLRFMGQSTGSLQVGVDKVIDLDEAYIESLLGSSTHLALLMENPTNITYAGIVSSEAAGTAPTLMIEYIVPPANGDFDGDDDIDGNDFLAWQRGQSPRPNAAADLTEWKTNFGTATVNSTSVPEPPVGVMIVGFAIAQVERGASRRR